MGLPVEVNNLMLGSLGGYTVSRSLRFRSSASAYLSRTFGTATSTKIFTFSAWVKRGAFGSYQAILGTAPSGSTYCYIFFDPSNTLNIENSTGGTNAKLTTTQVFRDPSAWYHIVIAVDTTQATASNRIKMYVNGAQITAFSTATYPSQNLDFIINQSYLTGIGNLIATYPSYLYDGYLAEVNFIDGQALTPSSFGAYDTNGVWQPKKYTGTYGTNGFYLPFNATTGWSLNTTTAGYLTVQDSTALNVTGAFTLEYWFYQSSSANMCAFDRGGGAATWSTTNGHQYLSFIQAGVLYWQWNTAGSTSTISTTAPAAGQWHHVAIGYNGTTTRMWLNGTSVGTSTNGYTVPSTSNLTRVGYLVSNDFNCTANISNLRMVKSDVYGVGNASITVPTSGLTAIANTALLTANSSLAVDAGPNNLDIRLQGDGKIVGFAPTLAGFGFNSDQSGNGNHWTPNNLDLRATVPSNNSPVSVASATGGLPIYNTTDTYGTVKGSGIATDSNASSVVLDVAMGTSAGLDITDQSPTGRTSATKTLTNNGSIVVSTSISKYYGGSADLTTTGRYFSLAHSTDFDMGTGDFTLETWIYPTAGECRLMCGQNPTGECAAIPGSGIYIGISGVGGQVLGGTIVTGKWQHVAFVRKGASIIGYIDGQQCPVAYQIGTTAFTFTTGTGSLIGRNHLSAGTAVYCPAYLQDFRVYKGVAKYTSSFNPPTSIGYANITTTYDVLSDSPTNAAGGSTGIGNYAVLNPLAKGSNVTTLSEANLYAACATASTNAVVMSTMGASSGKWYAEFTANGSTCMVGVSRTEYDTTSGYLGTLSTEYGYYGSTGNKYNNASNSAYGATYTTGDVIGIALDIDGGTLTFYKNNVSQGTAYTGLAAGTYYFGFGNANTGCAGYWNFGQRPFTYTPPSGYKALNTYNLPAPSIANGAQYMAATTYTGNGTSQSISNAVNGVSFQPDAVWYKIRSTTDNHLIFDSIRGAEKYLSPNLTIAESGTGNGTLTAFNSNGFSVGTNVNGNANGSTFVGWQWKGGGTAVTNNSGTITSTVSASPSSGFSIATYTGTGANATVGHGLGVAPSMVIVKQRSGANGWPVYHVSQTSAAYYMLLNQTDASNIAATVWNSTAPTSSVFSIGTAVGVNTSGQTYVAYCFSAVSGYSAFGKYTGNGSADGPFIYTGFRPRWVMIKNTQDGTTNWYIYDTSRDTYNIMSNYLMSNLSNAEASFSAMDYLSNGFKIRTSNLNFNNSGQTHIYAAFAESPFQISRAR